MRRTLLVLAPVLALALGLVAPMTTATANPRVATSDGTYTNLGDCDIGCGGTHVFDGTFAVGGVEIADVATFRWFGDDPPRRLEGTFVGDRLAGTCTYDRTLAVVPILMVGGEPAPTFDGTVACDVSVDGGPVQSFSFVLIITTPSDIGTPGSGEFHGI